MIPFHKIHIVFILFFLFFCSRIFSQDSATIYRIKYYTEKAEKYLDKKKALTPYYLINSDGISMYASAQDKLKNVTEFYIPWNQLNHFNNCLKEYGTDSLLKILKEKKLPAVSCSTSKKENTFQTEKKLQNLKIAIDAGHTAGDMETGKIEKKCLNFKCDSANGFPESIKIAEGILTFATAKLLKEKLEAEGADVFMTRINDGSSAFGKTFAKWLQQDYKKTVDSLYKAGKLSLSKKDFFLSKKATDSDKFRLIFKDLELEKRAEIINNYKPDLTIIIHYNVDETNTGWTKPAAKNFNMAFVGGAFMKGDLSSSKKRFEFLRLLVSDDLEKSITLSGTVVNSFEKNLNVKTATVKDATYLFQSCLTTDEVGVYCRNLQLTRYIHSPLVYGETLYQDNITECKLLNEECDKTKNKRVQQVAEAYYQGILNYLKK